VLLMGELPKFKREVLGVMRQPLEDGQLTISRATASLTYLAPTLLWPRSGLSSPLTPLLPTTSYSHDCLLNSATVNCTDVPVVINYGNRGLERTRFSVRGNW
jgi:hypothetical protein